jgi:hypothetical protein
VAVADPEQGEALRRAADTVRTAGYELGGSHYKRVPAGFDAPPEREDLLRHAGLYADSDGPVPPETHTAGFPRLCAERWRGLKPIQDWLVHSRS